MTPTDTEGRASRNLDLRHNARVPSLTACVVVIDGGRVLLTKREDFEVWCLPGGHVEPGESVGAAARRECREETGFEVVLDGLVGVYSVIGDWPDMHSCVFVAHLRTGRQQDPVTPEEVVAIDWYDPAALPHPMMWWHEDRVSDAVRGRRGLDVAQHVTSRLGRLDRVQLYRARDRSGLRRSEFFTATIGRAGLEGGS